MQACLQFAKFYFLRTSVVQYRQINAGTLALLVASSGAKLENTLLSTGGSKAPAYDIVYIAQLRFENKEYRNCLIAKEREENHMFLNMLKGKIHRATVVQAEIDYVGSITIDEELMEAAGILEYERVQVVDVNNGNRLETYVIAGEKGSGMICLNGAAAKLVEVGDKVIIMCYAQMTAEEFKDNPPRVVFVDDNNRINRITRYEKHGLLEDMA